MEAVKSNGHAIEHIPEKFRTPELWHAAVSESGSLLKEMPAPLVTEEICRLAVSGYGKALEFVPDKYRTKELFFAAVKQDDEALKLVDMDMLSPEEYTEICKIAFYRDNE
jgi:hypothetical protein